jgi:hypothetical protein
MYGISEWKTSLIDLQSVGEKKTKSDWVNFMFVSSLALRWKYFSGSSHSLIWCRMRPTPCWRCWTALSYGKNARLLNMSVSDVLRRTLRPKYVDSWENYTLKCFIVCKLRYRESWFDSWQGKEIFAYPRVAWPAVGPTHFRVVGGGLSLLVKR